MRPTPSAALPRPAPHLRGRGSRPPSRRSARAARIALLLTAAACGREDDSRPPGLAAATPVASRTATAPGTIAYVGAGGRELRLVRPDGSGDRLVWQLSDTLYGITAPAWRPDGREIAFASNHEMAVSFYERDLYTISPDGTGLQKLTNAPAHGELASRPKGTVEVAVNNISMDSGPYFVYVAGAPEPKLEVLQPLRTTRLTFEDVADLGDGVSQPVVVISGINRWWDAAAAPDVQTGGTVKAAPVSITATPLEHWGADGPFWNAEGSRVGFFLAPTCLVQQIGAMPHPGARGEPLLDPEVFGPVCAIDWAPTPNLPEPLLVVDMRDYTESGQTHILRVREGARERPAPVTTFDRYVRVMDIRWLPDGSGFLVARQDDLLDEDVNLYEYTFASGQLTKRTDLEGEHVRHFSISPDGASVVLERLRGNISDIATLPADLWVVDRDGSGMRLLVRNAAYPSWNPQAR